VITAVALDLDGTLVDSLLAWDTCYARVVTAHGGSWPPPEPERAGTAAWTRAALPDCDVAAVALEVDLLAAAWFAEHGFTWAPGAQRLLDELSLPCVLVTAGPRIVADTFLAWLGRDVFTAVVSGDDVADPKPAPDSYLQGAALLNASPAQCIAVEDSPAGVISALSAGYRTVYGVGNHHPALAALGATGIPDLNEVADLLRGLS